MEDPFSIYSLAYLEKQKPNSLQKRKSKPEVGNWDCEQGKGISALHLLSKNANL